MSDTASILLITNIVGFAASSISFILWLPQALVVWRSRRDYHALGAVSLGTQYLVLANASLWGVYAVLTSAFWTGAPGIINAPLALAIIFIIKRAKRNSERTTISIPFGGKCGCGWKEVTGHRIYITAPPGYGSVMECNGLGNQPGFPVIYNPPQSVSA